MWSSKGCGSSHSVPVSCVLFDPQNRKGQVPAEVVPDPMDMSLDKAEAALVAKELRTLLEEAVPLSCTLPKVTLPNYDNVPGNLMLSALGLRLGDRVLLDGQKVRGWGESGEDSALASGPELGAWAADRLPASHTVLPVS